VNPRVEGFDLPHGLMKILFDCAFGDPKLMSNNLVWVALGNPIYDLLLPRGQVALVPWLAGVHMLTAYPATIQAIP
jgi:hypothetical protein